MHTCTQSITREHHHHACCRCIARPCCTTRTHLRLQSSHRRGHDRTHCFCNETLIALFSTHTHTHTHLPHIPIPSRPRLNKRTHIQACIHTHMHTYAHAYIRTCIHTCTHTQREFLFNSSICWHIAVDPTNPNALLCLAER